VANNATIFNLSLLISGWVQSTIKNGSRSSAATSYLSPSFIVRPNLHILLHARVTRLITNGPNQFQTVEFVQDLEGAVDL
jgi:choline dehydrogenase-like flavoprotein